MVIAAMTPELAPFLDRATDVSGPTAIGHAEFWRGRLNEHDAILVRSGIGLVNAASAMTIAAIQHQPRLVVSVGTAGGIRGRVSIGDVVVGTTFTYSTANAVAFGYQLGQIPGMPVRFESPVAIVESADRLPGVVAGPIASGDVFVAGHLLDAVVADFPDVAAVDMESTALAQVCAGFGIPFASVRGISDLCGPAAADDHRDTVHDVSGRSAQVVHALLKG